MNQQYFAVKVRTLRKEMGLTQEQLADKMGMSVQAVSKWECADSYPDIGTLVRLADLFGVSIDALLRESESPKIYNEDPIVAELPKDDKLRIVQVYNGHVLSQDEFDPEVKIPLVFPDDKSGIQPASVEIWGSVSGDVNAGHSVACKDIGGSVSAGHSVACGSINGSVSAGHSVAGKEINGCVSAGNTVSCGDVNGSVTILGTNGNGTVECGDIAGDANVKFGSLSCT
ncbi:MAG: helix-turn-helix transcriptional regulator, partial [Clostridia bacterium]|nr:helix-turn-helix transcriptional regulator [Clostridia bacterium]